MYKQHARHKIVLLVRVLVWCKQRRSSKRKYLTWQQPQGCSVVNCNTSAFRLCRKACWWVDSSQVLDIVFSRLREVPHVGNFKGNASCPFWELCGHKEIEMGSSTTITQLRQCATTARHSTFLVAKFGSSRGCIAQMMGIQKFSHNRRYAIGRRHTLTLRFIHDCNYHYAPTGWHHQYLLTDPLKDLRRNLRQCKHFPSCLRFFWQ